MLDRSAKPKPPTRTSRRAARDARYRQRLQRGEAIALVCYGAETLDMLIRLRWLSEVDAGDKGKVGAAISALLRDAARR
jgi:hypothetical protein